MGIRISTLTVLLFAASTGLAQKTWIVDASGGAGSNFKDIQLAFDAAKHGDTVIVRKGIYNDAVTARG